MPLGTRRAFSQDGRIARFFPLKSQMASFFCCQFGFQTAWPLGLLLQGPIRPILLFFCFPSLCLRSLKSTTGCFHPTLTIHDHHSALVKEFFKKWFPQLWRFCLYLLTPLVLQTQSFLSVEHKRSHFKEWFCYFPITIHMKFIIAIDTFHVNCYWKINLSLTKG